MKKPSVLSMVISATVLTVAPFVGAQEQGEQHAVSGTTALASLIEEAKNKNPQILAAGFAYKAARNGPKLASALPDTQLMFQQLAVGSPRPFAGYTNSDFAYIGIGASQELPYPGKRKLRSEVAAREADSLQEQTESRSRDVVAQVKAVYFRLSYVQGAIQVLQHHDQVLGEMQQIAESRYRVGQGN